MSTLRPDNPNQPATTHVAVKTLKRMATDVGVNAEPGMEKSDLVRAIKRARLETRGVDPAVDVEALALTVDVEADAPDPANDRLYALYCVLVAPREAVNRPFPVESASVTKQAFMADPGHAPLREACTELLASERGDMFALLADARAPRPIVRAKVQRPVRCTDAANGGEHEVDDATTALQHALGYEKSLSVKSGHGTKYIHYPCAPDAPPRDLSLAELLSEVEEAISRSAMDDDEQHVAIPKGMRKCSLEWCWDGCDSELHVRWAGDENEAGGNAAGKDVRTTEADAAADADYVEEDEDSASDGMDSEDEAVNEQIEADYDKGVPDGLEPTLHDSHYNHARYRVRELMYATNRYEKGKTAYGAFWQLWDHFKINDLIPHRFDQDDFAPDGDTVDWWITKAELQQLLRILEREGFEQNGLEGMGMADVPKAVAYAPETLPDRREPPQETGAVAVA